MHGRVKFFSPEKRIGFVSNEGGEWFFHASAVIGELPTAGAKVEFWLDDGRRGDLIAVDVAVVAQDDYGRYS